VAKPKKAADHSFTLRYTTQVNVAVPEFHLLPSVKYLNAETLSLASKVKIDVGFFKTPCCDRHLRAVIEGGMVTKLEMEPCSDSTPASPDLVAFVNTALKRARRSPPRKWKPIPVKEFLASPQQINGGAETNCIEFTIFGHTIFCCRTGEGPISCVFIEPITIDR
jgi:hypothetical protein